MSCAMILKPSISGDYVAASRSEAGAGSDVASIRKTKARRDGDDYVIDGGKM